MFKKFQLVAQVVGFTTMTLLAVYGLLSLLSGGVAWAAALGGTQAAAPVNPATFNYQGFLRNADGSLATGSYTITAHIYDDAVAGTTQYTETFPSVTVRDGWFNVVLGDNPQGQDLQAVFSGMPRYIGLTLVGQGSELIPRQRFHGVPWALYATNASQASDFNVTGLFTATTITASGPARVAGLTVNGNATVNSDAIVNGNTSVSGSITAGGNITASGNISWTGHLSGLKLSGDFTANNWDGNNDVSTNMITSTNSLCFLTKTYVNSIGDNAEWAGCRIEEDTNAHLWILHAYGYTDGLYNAQAQCVARCLQW